jgi:hypothetical protein
VRVPADHAYAENNTFRLTSTPPKQSTAYLQVDVTAIRNGETVHLSPQALVYYGPFAIFDAVVASNASFRASGRHLPMLSTNPTVTLRVTLASSISPLFLSLLVTASEKDYVRLLLLMTRGVL